MSIVTLSKITWCGLTRDKEKTLVKLQELGCLHIIPLSEAKELRQVAGPTQQAREALQFLRGAKDRLSPSRDDEKFDASVVEKKALELRDAMARLTEEKDFLVGRIASLRPFGEFSFLPLEDMGGRRLWFYVVPHADMKQVVSRKGVWKLVKKDQRFSYVVVIEKDEPQDMPVPRVHSGSMSLGELDRRLKEVDTELEKREAEKKELTQWRYLYERDLSLLENRAAQSEVGQQTIERHDLFALQAWAPKKNIAALRDAARAFNAVLKEQEPAPDEQVPTLLENQPFVAGGADLVTFYMTPNYRMWDPSSIVFVSFAIFFAMILSDAGYAALMSAFLIWKWGVMSATEAGRRMRNLLTAVLGCSVVWGVLVGSYFGITPPEGSFLRGLKVLDLENTATMMSLSIAIGVFHICLANVRDAWRRRKTTEVFIPLGWIGIIGGGFIFGMSSGENMPQALKTVGSSAMAAGALMLVLFSSPSPNIFKRIFGGISSLTRLSSAFGDILSYLRLFALGLAGASLAVTFNGMAKQMIDGMPGIGIVFGVLIFLLGHVINLILSIVSCLVHGLRLNVIEFFNWSMYEEGRPFRPFARKGGVSWKD